MLEALQARTPSRASNAMKARSRKLVCSLDRQAASTASSCSAERCFGRSAYCQRCTRGIAFISSIGTVPSHTKNRRKVRTADTTRCLPARVWETSRTTKSEMYSEVNVHQTGSPSVRMPARSARIYLQYSARVASATPRAFPQCSSNRWITRSSQRPGCLQSSPAD